MTDPEGYAEPVINTENPWHHYFGDRIQHNLPCLPQQPIWLIRHPNAELAQAFVRWLDTGEAQEGYDFDDWGTPEELKFQGTATIEEKQCVLKVPEDSKHFLPKGSELYEGWTLYRDMPNASCSPVVKQVGRLQRHLGTLRYPIGPESCPYWPMAGEGALDGRTQAALGGFQENAQAGTAARVIDRALTHGKHVEPTSPFEAVPRGGGAAGAWAYLLATEEVLSGEASLSSFTLGCADSTTGRAIEAWLDKGLRKPGPVMLDVSWGRSVIWLRQEAAVATEAWNELLDALGVVYASGLSSGHSFRDVLDKGSGGGKRLNSIHKTGLAIDMSSFGYTTMRPEWPVRIEGEWTKENPALRAAQGKLKDLASRELKAQRAYDEAPATAADIPKGKRAKLKNALEPALMSAKVAADAQRQKVTQLEAEDALDTSGKKNTFRLKFRIYVHSSRAVFGMRWDVEHEVEKIRERLRECERRLRARLSTKLGTSQDAGWNAMASSWLSSASELAAHASKAILALDDEELVHRFFRETVSPWIYDPLALDGGAEGRALGPKLGLLPYYPPPPRADTVRSYVNASALGGLCKMARIGATRNGCWKDPSGMKGKLTLAVLRVGNGLEPIIQALDFMRSPRSAHRTDTVSLTHAGKETELTQAQIDLEALRAWSKLLPEISKANGKQAVAAISIPQVMLTLAVAEKRKAALEKVLGILEGSRCNVLVLNPGSATRMDALAQAIVPCSKVVATLRTTITQIDELAKKEKADQDAWKKEVTDAKKQRRKPNIPKPIPSKARTSAELSVTLQPVFIVGASAEKVLFYPKDTLELPALGNPQGLEWWHFQHECAARRPWGDLLKEIGFSQEVLQAPDVPATDSTFWGRGVDYDPSNFPDASGGVGVTNEQIEDNFNEFKPWSWGLPKNPF